MIHNKKHPVCVECWNKLYPERRVSNVVIAPASVKPARCCICDKVTRSGLVVDTLKRLAWELFEREEE